MAHSPDTTHVMQIRPYQASDEEAVVALWQECGVTRPWNDPRRDIARKLSVQADLFLIAAIEDRPVGTAMVGFDGHRGWVYYLAVAPDHRRQSIGRQLIAAAEQRLIELGCPKINLMVRAGNDAVMEFYRKLGYAQDAAVTLGRRLIPDV